MIPMSSERTAILVISILILNREEKIDMDNMEVLKIENPKSLKRLFPRATPVLGPDKASLTPGLTSSPGKDIIYPPGYRNMTLLAIPSLTPANFVRSTPNKRNRTNGRNVRTDIQTPVRNRVHHINGQDKENRMPLTILPTAQTETMNISPLLALMQPLREHNNPDFTVTERLREIYKNNMKTSKSPQSQRLRRKYSYQVEKLPHIPVHGSYQLQNDGSPKSKRRRLLPSTTVYPSSRKRRSLIINTTPVALHQRIEIDDKLQIGASASTILIPQAARTLQEELPKAAAVSKIECSFTEANYHLPTPVKNDIQPQAPIMLQSKTSLLELQMVLGKPSVQLASPCHDVKEGSHSGGRSFSPIILPPTQFITNVQKQLIQSPPLLLPAVGGYTVQEAHMQEQNYSVVKPHSKFSNSNSVVSLPPCPYRPSLSPAAGRFNVQLRKLSYPELYLRIPNSNVFVPVPKYQHLYRQDQAIGSGTQTNERSRMLYTLPSQMTTFGSKYNSRFTVYSEVNPSTSQATISGINRFFQVAGYLILQDPTSALLQEECLFPDPTLTNDNGSTYDLLSMRPRIGHTTSALTCRHVPLVVYRQPNPLYHAGQQVNSSSGW